jgi:hypothetical protein
VVDYPYRTAHYFFTSWQLFTKRNGHDIIEFRNTRHTGGIEMLEWIATLGFWTLVVIALWVSDEKGA